MITAYSYEHVLRDSAKYPKRSEEGMFYAWWEIYLSEEGFQVEYLPFMELYNLPLYEGRMVGLLGLDIPRLQYAHVVAVDELGVVDPADNSPPHTDIAAYVLDRIHNHGAVFHKEFLAVVVPATATR
jgi:hypothetical protein